MDTTGIRASSNIQHFATCDKTGRIWSALADLAGVQLDGATTTERERFALFAIAPNGTKVE